MRRDLPPVLALAAAWWLFADQAAVWGPSLITIFGQAAATPAELMGLFALGCVLAGIALAAVTRRGPLPLAALGVALLARLVLATSPGGQVQLWASSVGVAAALAWLAHLSSRHGPSLASGISLGWLVQTTVAAIGGTWLPVWRTDVYAVLSLAALALLVVATARPALVGTGAPSRRQAWSLWPVLLVAGVAVVNAGRASAVDATWGPLVLVVGCAAAVLVTTWDPPRPARAALCVLAVGAVALSLLGTDTVQGVPGTLAPWTLLAFLLGPSALAALLGPDEGDAGTGAPAVATGAVLWVLLFFAYYAGYDLGYRADLLLVLVALAVAVVAAARRPGTRRAPARPTTTNLAVVALAVCLAAAAAVAHRPPSEAVEADGDDLEVVAYNVRMGYGLDGRFDPESVATVIAGADVALLSEIDRGWLLNGGQDQLAVLARLTGMRLHFGPAADPVWGDAVLTRLPVDEVRGTPLPSYDAVTGAGMISTRVLVDGRPVWFVSTHVQPTETRADGTIDQAQDIAAVASRLGADGTPVVLGGDFNFEPGSASFQAVLHAGFTDALADVRPLPTSGTADPEEQIDHLFTLGDWAVSSPGAPQTEASDHLPVRATLRLLSSP